MSIKDARQYAKKNGVKFTYHKDGTISVRHHISARPGTNSENVRKRLLRPIRGIQKRLRDEGYEYVPSSNNYKGAFPNKTIKCKFQRK